ncbi:hypothetical protein LWI29_033467 [Acer saccharum]|uniref:RDR1/2-like RRM domain-containing protein n=1 Tax=Acer saccharum TaxID=4024 RepID=A0AA39RP42_ACESA|nr:hypothetical protein LWI29_033467 [Acer saccharum]
MVASKVFSEFANATASGKLRCATALEHIFKFQEMASSTTASARLCPGAETIRVFGFPGSVTSEVVKEFLELYTSEGTVYAIKIRQAKANRGGVPKAYAINLRFIPANRNSSTSNNKEKEKA